MASNLTPEEALAQAQDELAKAKKAFNEKLSKAQRQLNEIKTAKDALADEKVALETQVSTLEEGKLTLEEENARLLGLHEDSDKKATDALASKNALEAENNRLFLEQSQALAEKQRLERQLVKVQQHRVSAPSGVPFPLDEDEILTPDTDIPPLPLFNQDMRNMQVAEQGKDSAYSRKLDKFQQLRDTYNIVSNQVLAFEKSVPAAQRTKDQRTDLANYRQRLQHVYQDAQALAIELAKNTAVKKAQTIALRVPPDARNARTADVRDIVGLCAKAKDFPDAGEMLMECWDKLDYYARSKPLNHDGFKQALDTVLSGPVYNYYKLYRDRPLPEIAKLLATRFLPEDRLTVAMRKVHSFKREKDENIRMAMARLEAAVDQSMVYYADAERPAAKDLALRSAVFRIVKDSSKAKLEEFADKAALDGAFPAVDELIRKAEHFEKYQAEGPGTQPLRLFQAEIVDTIQQAVTNTTKPAIQALASQVQQIESKVDEALEVDSYPDEDVEVNVAVASKPQMKARSPLAPKVNILAEPRLAPKAPRSGTPTPTQAPSSFNDFRDNKVKLLEEQVRALKAGKAVAAASRTPSPGTLKRFPSYEKMLNSINEPAHFYRDRLHREQDDRARSRERRSAQNSRFSSDRGSSRSSGRPTGQHQQRSSSNTSNYSGNEGLISAGSSSSAPVVHTGRDSTVNLTTTSGVCALCRKAPHQKWLDCQVVQLARVVLDTDAAPIDAAPEN